MPRSSPTAALVTIFLVALCSLVGSASAVSIFTAPNGALSLTRPCFARPRADVLAPRPGCPTALAARAATNAGSYGPRAAPVAGVDYNY